MRVNILVFCSRSDLLFSRVILKPRGFSFRAFRLFEVKVGLSVGVKVIHFEQDGSSHGASARSPIGSEAL